MYIFMATERARLEIITKYLYKLGLIYSVLFFSWDSEEKSLERRHVTNGVRSLFAGQLG
jgi:hypothetical protein